MSHCGRRRASRSCWTGWRSRSSATTIPTSSSWCSTGSAGFGTRRSTPAGPARCWPAVRRRGEGRIAFKQAGDAARYMLVRWLEAEPVELEPTGPSPREAGSHERIREHGPRQRPRARCSARRPTRAAGSTRGSRSRGALRDARGGWTSPRCCCGSHRSTATRRTRSDDLRRTRPSTRVPRSWAASRWWTWQEGGMERWLTTGLPGRPRGGVRARGPPADRRRRLARARHRRDARGAARPARADRRAGGARRSRWRSVTATSRSGRSRSTSRSPPCRTAASTAPRSAHSSRASTTSSSRPAGR